MSTVKPPLSDATSKKRLAENLGSAPGSKKRRIVEPRREKNAVVDLDVAMKVRRERKKLLCGSANTVTGKPCKLRLHSDGAGCHIASYRGELEHIE